MRTLILFLFINVVCFSQEILSPQQTEILNDKNKIKQNQADILEHSWINPVIFEVDLSKNKHINSSASMKNKKIFINIEQDIYKSGGITKTIDKAKILKIISTLEYIKNRRILESNIYEMVLNLSKIDLQIEKVEYFISNKNIDILKQENMYKNGLLELFVLDESIIEVVEHKNEKEDLLIKKNSLLLELASISNENYKDIDVSQNRMVSFDIFMNNNINIKVDVLSYEKNGLDREITASLFLPKISAYATYGYENMEREKNDTFYSYGLKLNIPFDYNSKKERAVKNISFKLAGKKLAERKKDEILFYKYIKEDIKLINNKIKNSVKILRKYENIFLTVKEMHHYSLKTVDDVNRMLNTIKINTLKIKILTIDKKLIINKIYKKLKPYNE